MPAENSSPAARLSNHDRVKSDEHSAQLYTRRNPGKHRSEMRLVARAFDSLPGGTVKSVLDAPCGVGRISAWLARQGHEVTGVDLGEAAVRLSRDLLAEEGLAAALSVQNIMAMDFAERQFDCCICFRLLHHFRDRQDKARLIRELCRVSSRFVVISYFSTRSLTTLKRRLRQQITGKPLKQYPDDLRALERLFSSNGFRLFSSVERSRVLHSLQVAVFERAN